MNDTETEQFEAEATSGRVSAAAPGPMFVIDPSRGGWASRLREAFGRRELLLMLVRRDIAVRYREAVLGVAWAVLIPAATLGVYWFVFDVVFER